MNLQAAIDLIKEFEGCKLNAYPDPASGGAPWTIGFGTTGSGISEGTTWTQEQADDALESRVESIANFVNRQLMVKATNNQVCAMTCLAYNIGIGNFAHSSLLKAFNLSDFYTAANDFLQWNHAGGIVMEGLTRRRQAERTLFLT